MKVTGASCERGTGEGLCKTAVGTKPVQLTAGNPWCHALSHCMNPVMEGWQGCWQIAFVKVAVASRATNATGTTKGCARGKGVWHRDRLYPESGGKKGRESRRNIMQQRGQGAGEAEQNGSGE